MPEIGVWNSPAPRDARGAIVNLGELDYGTFGPAAPAETRDRDDRLEQRRVRMLARLSGDVWMQAVVADAEGREGDADDARAIASVYAVQARDGRLA